MTTTCGQATDDIHNNVFNFRYNKSLKHKLIMSSIVIEYATSKKENSKPGVCRASRPGNSFSFKPPTFFLYSFSICKSGKDGSQLKGY